MGDTGDNSFSETPLLHRGEHVARPEQKLRKFLRDLLAQAAKAGDVRRDIAPDELASYCLNALAGAGACHRRLPSSVSSP